MDRLPKLRRKAKNPTISTGALRSPPSSTAVAAASDNEREKPTEKAPKTPKTPLSALRALQLKKRTRSPPPVALPQSPTHAVVGQDGVEHTRSPPRPDTKHDKRHGHKASSRKAKMPSFLTQSAYGTYWPGPRRWRTEGD